MPDLKPRYCHLLKNPNKSLGFNLHGEKNVVPSPGKVMVHTIKSVETDSPAEKSGLKAGDRVIQVNGTDVECKTHSDVVEIIKKSTNDVWMLVIDHATDLHFQNELSRKPQIEDSVYGVLHKRGQPVDMYDSSMPGHLQKPPTPVSTPASDHVSGVDEADNAKPNGVVDDKFSSIETARLAGKGKKHDIKKSGEAWSDKISQFQNL